MALLLTSFPRQTPTPRRFLLSKRPPASQQQTPGSGPPVFAGSQRFQTTPRFAPPSATQRPPSTPVFPGSLRPSRTRDPIHDALDSSPTDAPVSATRPALATGTKRQNNRIEIDSDIESDSQYEQEGIRLPPPTFVANDSIEIESEPPSVSHSEVDERTPKRRRISISPAPTWHDDAQEDVAMSSQDGNAIKDYEDEYVDEELPDAEDKPTTDFTAPSMDAEDLSIPFRHDGDMPKTQPTFRRAPRFKVSEAEASRQEGLPEAFSPQRRGAKYVPGGLAAELQTWLAEVKGWAGGDRPADLVMTIIIDELRAGNRMYIVRGRRIVGDGDASEEIAARLMLAGEGRLTGLGQKAAVIVGSTVAISQPAWEVELEGTRWIVACDWAVL
ncbi:uncharacterized protein ColSpa_09257 [Colletotrichum spaethianum]|uniref:Uncharacterized protein n=1 Tax=Colletotrichum spaethianum TaxID=700344 RepID=A0AA37PBD6_9PEZI|nr:uncharacterized protein ColSpa_09257 [Colletotrichum spaethianum]GKT49076.1 hypothetical protein ColSpa_09257 [Colletotrichum spaethianum]